MSNDTYTESLCDSNELDFENMGSALSNLYAPVFILLSFLPVLLLDLRNRKSNRSRDAKRTKCLMIGVFCSNLAFQTMFILYYTVCTSIDCNILDAAFQSFRFAAKGINLLFFIHRANLVQGMSPMLSKVWFEKRMPALVLIYITAHMIWSITNISMANEKCHAYSDTDAIGICHWNRDDQSEQILTSYLWKIWLQISLDVVMVTFLMFLFVVPLYRVYRQDLGHMNTNQLRQRQKLRKLLVWSMALTFINQVSTTMGPIWWVGHLKPCSFLWWFLMIIAAFDPSINVWTSWLVVSRNRQHLQSVCCCGGSTKTLRRMQSRALTDAELADSLPTMKSQSALELSSVDVTTISQTMNDPVRLQSS